MLVRPHDAPRDAAEWRALLAAHDFGQLVLPGKRAFPVVSPTHFVMDGDDALLHLAAPNPAFDAIGENPAGALCVVAAYTYIPSGWNASKEEGAAWGVPTSYYAAVQLLGDVEIVSDADGIADILTRMLAHFEPETARVVRAGDNPDARQFGAIRGIRLRSREVRAKFKFGGNRTAEHRARVGRHLAERGAPLDLEAREHLLRRG